ncbi:uncharacterized protein LOC109720302 [Ananas comosus]|uniref:Uncharacterized protein LOC109720302 n=1 Tax=Ananas comosus TaxID=4615 RepID=A0A6P5G4Y3_ANACO|nr:uncharacterized protein LOC109720302 [Ananas comosus]
MASASHVLLGPPEARLAPYASAAASAAARGGEPFVDAMDSEFNSAAGAAKGVTENLSPTFVASGDACVDFFFHVVPGADPGWVGRLLASAWAADAATALRLVCQLRGVRGSGKSDREGFYASAAWLHDHHPKTLALNLPSVAQFGYLKDLPEILHRLVTGGPSRTRPPRPRRPDRRGRRFCTAFAGRRRRSRRNPRDAAAGRGTREERIAADLERGRRIAAEAAELRRRRRGEAAARAVERYARDPAYRLLHDSAAELFAELLAADLRSLGSGAAHPHLSLAAKWCPSLDSCYDLSTLLCEAVARRLFPRESDPAYADLPDAHYAYRVRDRLRREALVPLRRALQLPEVYISAGEWGLVPYERVASVAMKNYTPLFTKRDGDRFGRYLADVREGKAKIAAGALLPHEILFSCAGEVAELQWRRMVDDLLARGKLRNCIAVCDVSGSMSGEPMDVAVALGLLVSELSEEPWKGRVITFSAEPELHKIAGDSLQEKTEFMKRMDWGMNTDFQEVFDRMLEVAVAAALPPEKMVKRVFVFSDMEFDVASETPWETDYEAIQRKYGESGYGTAVPEVVFWNLRASRSVPVTAGQKGVALVSGFSKNLLKLFLDGDGVVSPRAVMEAALAGKEYEKLAVFD